MIKQMPRSEQTQSLARNDDGTSPMLSSHRRNVCAMAAAMFLGLACATVPAGPPPPPPKLSVGAVLRRIEPVGQTVLKQTRGGVTITLAPVPFDTQTTTACAYDRAGFSLIVPEGVSRETHTRLEEQRFQVITVSPSALSLLLTIRNGMGRVFRGAGAVVQLKVDQTIQAAEQSDYLEFINALIPPQAEQQVRLKGPSLTALTDSATFAVLLFDVVTAIDNAGSVRNRDNFEWYFRVRHQPIRRTLDAIQSRRSFWVTNTDARAALSPAPASPGSLPTTVIRPDGTQIATLNVRDCMFQP